MKFAAWYGIFVGVLIAAVWIFLLTTGQVPEWDTQRTATVYRLLADSLTAVSLVVLGFRMLKKPQRWKGEYLFSAGMLVYSLTANFAYFYQKSRIPVVIVFCILLAAAFLCVRLVLNSRIVKEGDASHEQ